MEEEEMGNEEEEPAEDEEIMEDEEPIEEEENGLLLLGTVTFGTIEQFNP